MRLYLLITLIFTPQAKAANGSACAMIRPPPAVLAAVTTKLCEETKASVACQKIYKMIADDFGDVESKQLNCQAPRGGLQFAENLVGGCLIGAFDTMIGDLGRSLGKGLAEADWQVEKNRERLKACDKNSVQKANIYKVYNSSVPKLLQVTEPAAEDLKKKTCEELELSLRHSRQAQLKGVQLKYDYNSFQRKEPATPDELEYLNWKKQQEQKLNPIQSSNASTQALLDLAFKKLEEFGVRLECYNFKAATALTCEALFTVGTGYSLVKSAGLKALSGIKNLRSTEVLATAPRPAVPRKSYYEPWDADKLELALKEPILNKKFKHAEALGDPHIQFLKELGVRRVGDRLMADPNTIVTAIESKVNNLIRKGALTTEDVIYPARVFQNNEGKKIVLRYGEKPPQGFFEATDGGIISNDLFWVSVEQGKMPMGSVGTPVFFNSPNDRYSLIDAFWHDLSHQSALLQNPEYMKALRDGARHINSLPEDEKRKAIQRAFIATEFLSTAPLKAEKELTHLFKAINVPMRNGQANSSEFAKNLKAGSSDDLIKVAEKIGVYQPETVYWGGTVRDPLVRTSTLGGSHEREFFRQGSSPTELFKYIENLKDQLRAAPQDQWIKDSLAQHVQRAVEYMDLSKGMTPAQVTRDVIHGNKQSNFYKLHCQNASYPMTIFQAKICD